MLVYEAKRVNYMVGLTVFYTVLVRLNVDSVFPHVYKTNIGQITGTHMLQIFIVLLPFSY